MNPETLSSLSPKTTNPIDANFDEFNINEDSFKPMTKGLGFHQDQKRASFNPAPKEVKPFGVNRNLPKISTITNMMTGGQASQKSAQHIPTGLEAFYEAKGNPGNQNVSENKFETTDTLIVNQVNYRPASSGEQFFAWIIDLFVIASFVAVTGSLLAVASGIQLKVLARLISTQDLIFFTTAIFSIYYLLYFTVLDLSASPGKTIMGIRLLLSDNNNVSVKNTFLRSFISLLSGVALFLPMFLDFQGRLSDTKLVK